MRSKDRIGHPEERGPARRQVAPAAAPRLSAGGKAGFTILETLVAITILLLAVTGPMVFAQQALRAARLSGDQITAFYLAQDAIELVKHVRDENSVYTQPGEPRVYREDWLLGLAACLTATGCQVSSPDLLPGDSVAAAVELCPGGDCPLFRTPVVAPDSGEISFFGKSGPGRTPSKFSRRVRIMAPDGSDLSASTAFKDEEALVEVEVSWTTLGIQGPPRKVLVREHIYNWIQ